MLEFIRERAQGWIAWLIVGLLIIPFALWGINQYFTGEGKAQVARVNDTEIGLRDYQQALQFQRERVRSMLGANASPEMIENLVRPQDVVQALVENEVMVQAAESNGLGVSEKDLRQQIQSIEAFQQDGKFSNEQYERLLRTQGDTPATFEYRLQRGIMTNQLRTGIMDTVYVSDFDLDQYIRLNNQSREYRQANIEATAFAGKVQVSDDEIKSHYEANLSRYMDPEHIRLEYVELSSDALKAAVEFTNNDIEGLYEEEKNRFGVDEQRKARHILIALNASADDATKTAARNKADELVKKLRAGADFAALARQNSADPGSAKQGGDLGMFGKGVMAPEFEAAAFSLKQGEISEPVLTSFGYHIIRVDEIKPATIKPLAQVRDQLIDIYKTRKAEQMFYDMSESLANLAYDNPESLAPVQEELRLPIKETAFFTRAGGAPGIPMEAKVRTTAFGEDVLKKNFNSEPLEIGPNHVVVIRLKEHRAQSQLALEAVKEQIQKELQMNKAKEQAAKLGEALLAELRKGGSLEQVAKANNLTLAPAVSISRKEKSAKGAVGEAVFRMLKPQDKAAYELVSLSDGGYGLLELLAVKDGDPATVVGAERDKLRKDLAGKRGETQNSQFVNFLKSKASIAYSLENIK